jgi:ATP-binding cassette, subfamily B, bacterial PglK
VASMDQLFVLLGRRGGLQLTVLVFCSLLGACFELVGVGSIVPFIAVAAEPERITAVPILHHLYAAGSFASPRSFLLFWAAVMLAAITMVNTLTGITVWLGCKLGAEQQHAMSLRLYRTYLQQPLGWHFTHSSVELQQSLGRIRDLVEGVYKPFATLLARGASALALVALLVFVNPMLTAVSAGFMGVIFGVVYLRARRSVYWLSNQQYACHCQMAKTAADSFGAISHVLITGAQGTYAQRYSAALQRFGRYNTLKQLYIELPRITLHLVVNAAILFVVLYLQATLAEPEMLIPTVALFAAAAYRAVPSLQLCLSHLLTIESNLPVLHMLAAELQGTSEPIACPINTPPLSWRQSVALQNATYAYPRQPKPVIENCSLLVSRGSCVGIFGATGQGKTTLLHLLMGLLQPQNGTLQVDGEVVSDARVSGWQRCVGYVPQDVFLADTTIGENITLGIAPELVNQSRLQTAARQAILHDFIESLPLGYGTPVGERGVQLSGGQRQRIGLARALYRQPSFLVLDEATSALDTTTESDLLHTLATLRGSLTIVLVSHRLVTLQECDAIFCLGQDGTLAPQSSADLSSVR